MSNIRLEDIPVYLFDSMYDAVLIVDHCCQVVYCNDAYCRMSGIPREIMLGKPISEMRPNNKITKVVRDGTPQVGIYRNIGNREWISNIVPIYRDGEIIGGLSMSVNAQDVFQYSAELNKVKDDGKKLKELSGGRKYEMYTFDSVVAQAPESQGTRERARLFAGKDVPVLILGESGTGKEVYAQAIHSASLRRNERFLALNCAAISSSLIESELFGYVEGAFTGAKKGGKPGIFESAQGGTVFLDEIGDMDYYAQAKLLRVLQERMVLPVGSNEARPVDFRLIAATNRNLRKLIAEGKFRLDLYYRIASFTLELAPLKERKEDILPLIESFLVNEGKQVRKNLRISDEALAVLLNYDWPGNIRELHNAVRVAAVLAETDVIGIHNLPHNLRNRTPEHWDYQLPQLKDAVRETESRVIRQAIQKYGDTKEGKKLAAQALGISLATLYNKLR